MEILGKDRAWDSLTNEDTITRNYVELSGLASTYTNEVFRTSAAIQAMSTQFDTSCRGVNKCTLDFDYHKLDAASFDEMLRRAWSSRSNSFWMNYDTLNEPAGSVFNTRQNATFDASVPEPLLYIIAECDNQVMRVAGTDIMMTKSQLNYFLILSDAILISVFIVGYNIIAHM